MAVLEKIRKRIVFLILVIGLALFAFVISGIFSRNTTPDQLVIGSVNGDGREIGRASCRERV